MAIVFSFLTFILPIHRDLNFYGFLIIRDYDKPVVVAFDKQEFSNKIESYSFNDNVKEYAKIHFKKPCNQAITLTWEGKKYQIAVVLNDADRKRLLTYKKYLNVTLLKTRQLGKIQIFLTSVSKYSE